MILKINIDILKLYLLRIYLLYVERCEYIFIIFLFWRIKNIFNCFMSYEVERKLGIYYFFVYELMWINF